MNGVFVTGTDTGVGKTLVSAWLVGRWRADYWKPVQSGSIEGTDSDAITRLAPGAVIHPPAYVFKAPLSPDQAARCENAIIDLDRIRLPATQNSLVVEGAGGALVPLRDDALMIDLMVHLGLPVLVVARSGLGTINHTLLTLEALRNRELVIQGVVMNGPPEPENRAAIERFGRVRVLAELPSLPDAFDLSSLPQPGWQP